MDSADDLVAVIAGRLAVRMVFQGFDTAKIAKLSVELARAIVAEVERTRPVAEFKGMGPVGAGGGVAAAALDEALLYGGERGGKTDRAQPLTTSPVTTDQPARPVDWPLHNFADMVERTANGQHRRGFYMDGYARLVIEEWQAIVHALRLQAGSGTPKVGHSVRVKNGVVTITPPSPVELACAAIEDEIRALCERKQVDWRDAASFIVRKHGMNGTGLLADTPSRQPSPDGPPIAWGDQREKS